MKADVKLCDRCGAPILMLRDKRSGRIRPIDAHILPGGSVDIDLDAQTYTIVPLVDREEYPVLRTLHWLTCPERQAWKWNVRNTSQRKGIF